MEVLGVAHPGVQPGTTDSTGAVTIPICHNQLGLFWRVHQLSVDSGGVLQVEVVFNGLPCTSAITAGSPVTASGEPPIDIAGHDTLNVVVTNARPKTPVVVTYFYEEIQGAP
jgi:hypothetical protein